MRSYSKMRKTFIVKEQKFFEIWLLGDGKAFASFLYDKIIL